jgi:proline dehydrogenase
MGLKEVFLLPVAKRWISGVDLKAAVKDAKASNARGMGAVVNFLGEDILDLAMADSHTEEYLRLQNAIAESSIRGSASVKLTQLGLALGDAPAAERLERIASNSDRLGQWLWIDMESSKFTAPTIAIYEAAHEKHPKLGLALQSYLKRSNDDLKRLLDRGAKVRLVKGAYKESGDKVYPSRQQIRENFTKDMELLFQMGENFAIATHDGVLVDAAKKIADSKHVDFEFEMLKGIRDELKKDLVKSGYKVSEYLPYGDRWYAYSKRRMSEHPSNIWLLLRSMV